MLYSRTEKVVKSLFNILVLVMAMGLFSCNTYTKGYSFEEARQVARLRYQNTQQAHWKIQNEKKQYDKRIARRGKN